MLIIKIISFYGTCDYLKILHTLSLRKNFAHVSVNCRSGVGLVPLKTLRHDTKSGQVLCIIWLIHTMNFNIRKLLGFMFMIQYARLSCSSLNISSRQFLTKNKTIRHDKPGQKYLQWFYKHW